MGRETSSWGLTCPRLTGVFDHLKRQIFWSFACLGVLCIGGHARDSNSIELLRHLCWQLNTGSWQKNPRPATTNDYPDPTDMQLTIGKGANWISNTDIKLVKYTESTVWKQQFKENIYLLASWYVLYISQRDPYNLFQPVQMQDHSATYVSDIFSSSCSLIPYQ